MCGWCKTLLNQCIVYSAKCTECRGLIYQAKGNFIFEKYSRILDGGLIELFDKRYDYLIFDLSGKLVKVRKFPPTGKFIDKDFNVYDIKYNNNGVKVIYVHLRGEHLTF